jgi:hypothetical protein
LTTVTGLLMLPFVGDWMFIIELVSMKILRTR